MNLAYHSDLAPCQRVLQILGGEVDCIDEKGDMVELKTSAQIRNPRDEERFEKKMLRFCQSSCRVSRPFTQLADQFFGPETDTQSFLLGIPRVVVGFRDFKGLLHVSTSLFSQSDLDRSDIVRCPVATPRVQDT